MYKFIFTKDYYNEEDKLSTIVRYAEKADALTLDDAPFSDHLLVLDLSKPVGCHGFKITREEVA